MCKDATRQSDEGSTGSTGSRDGEAHRWATKASLLADGHAACPLAVLADRRLTHVAKAVYQAILWHLRGEDLEAWPAIPRLAEMTASDRASVIRAIAQLESDGWIMAERVAGKSTRFRFLPPAERVAKCDGSQNATGRKMPPHPSQNATAPVAKCDPNQDKNRGTNNTPPTPPLRGGAVGDFDSSDSALAPEAVVDSIITAWREVHGEEANLPRRWPRRLTKGLANGDGWWIRRVDATAIRGGMKMAADRGRTFGLGWVERFIADRSAGEQDRKRNSRASGKGSESRLVQAAKREQEMAARQAATLAAFDGLTSAEREPWLAKARRSFQAASDQDRQTIAAGMWQAAQPKGVATK